MSDLWFEAALAAIAAAAVTLAARRRAPFMVVVALGLAIVAGIYVANPVHRVYSFHGFWHHAITYEILNGHLPPHDPLAAGQKLSYAWGMHLVAAALTAVLDMTPAVSFALMNAACFAITTALLWKLAHRLGFDRTASIFAATVPLYGITPGNFGRLAVLVQPYLPVEMEFRGTPLMAQFTHVNGGSLGLLFYVLALDSLAGIFVAERAPGVLRFAGLAVAMAGAAFFYPLMFIGAAGASGACVAVFALRRAERRRVLGAAASVLAGTLAAAPYLLLIGGGRDPAGAIRVEGDWRSLVQEVARFGMTALAVGVVILWRRDRFVRFLREQREAAVLLGTAAAATAALYVVMSYPQNAEYKLQALAALTLGVLVSPMLASLHERRGIAAFVVLTAMFLPLGADVLLKVHPKWWNVTDPHVERGRAIESADPAEAELGRWIRAHTSVDDAFIDSRMTIPVFAERALFYPVDVRRRTLRGWRPNGWLASPRGILHELEGLPLSLIDAREDLVNALLVVGRPVGDAALAAARRSIPADLYVIARDPAAAERLARDARFQSVFANRAATLYRLRG